MNTSEVNRFNELYERHLKTLRLQGKAQKTVVLQKIFRVKEGL